MVNKADKNTARLKSVTEECAVRFPAQLSAHA